MIILDSQQVFLRAVFRDMDRRTNEFSVPMVRHLALNIIRAINSKYRSKYGELVFALEGQTNWRSSIFPYYKMNRKKAQDASAIDWKKVLECTSQIRDELVEVFPYKFIRVDGAEADDVISALVRRADEPVLIVSTDGDFRQLQKFSHVRQWNPIDKVFINCDNPDHYLQEHIIRGDSGDGVPNIKSPDDCFVVGQRQKPILSKHVENWLGQAPEDFCDSVMLRNYYRNEQLIDLSKTPKDVVENIHNVYDNYKVKNGRDILSYMITNRLGNLMESINDF